MRYSQFVRRAAMAGVCVGVGAAAGIAGSAAAPNKSSGSAAARRASGVAGTTGVGPVTLPAPPGVAIFKIGGGGPPVHGVEVVPNEAGDGFDTVTEDAGVVKSISGDALTITEATDKATYGTPTLTIGGGATVIRNFAKARLSDIKVGDHIDVSSSSDGTTTVFATDSEHLPPKAPGFGGCGKLGPLPPLPGRPGGPRISGFAMTVPAGSLARAKAAYGRLVRLGGASAAVGATGVTGATGATGPTGAAGVAGAAGAAGAGNAAIVKLGVANGPMGGVVCSYFGRTP